MRQVFNDEMAAGAIIIAVVAAFSLFFLFLTLLHIFFTLVLPAYAQRISSPRERRFIMSPLGFYIICLFASNVISAMGGVMQTRWVDAGAITEGPACSSQAFMLQLGSNATALWIGVISVSALRTFLFRARSLSRMATLLLVCALWIAMIIFDALASTFFSDHSGNFFYGIAFLWCWITPSHRAARLFTQYIWMWVWSLVSVVCFFLVFLSVRGNITMKRGGLRRSMKWNKRATFDSYALGRGDEQDGTLVGTVGKTMCWFPISYITLTLPISVSRALETFGFRVPVYAFVFSAICSLLLGISFPILYFAICHSLKHASTGIYSSATLCEDLLSGESFYCAKETRLSPISKRNSHSWAPTPTPSRREDGVPPSHHQDISKATSTPSTRIGGGEDGMSAYGGSNGPSRRPSVSLQVAPGVRSFHRHMDSSSTVTSSGTAAGPAPLSHVIEGKLVMESINSQISLPPAAVVAHRYPRQLNVGLQSELDKKLSLLPGLGPASKRSAASASTFSPLAISPDLNALLLASQTPTSPSGPPPPPRKMKRVPIPSVPVDVDESDQGSILSALPSIEVFDTEDIRPIRQERPDSMHTFWAAYGSRSPMTPNIPLSANAASMRDTMHTLWADYEDRSPSTANTPMTSDIASFRRGSMSDSNILSPDSPQFQRCDPSVSLRPSISAVGRARMNISPRPSSRIMGNLPRSKSSAILPVPPRAALHSDTTGLLHPSYSATPLLNDSYAQRTRVATPSEMSTDRNYRAPYSQPGHV